MRAYRSSLLAPTLIVSLLVIVSGCARNADSIERKKIAGIVFQEDQFFRLVLFGMRTAAAEHGVELLEANSAGKPDKEIQLINTYIARKVDGIVVSPLSAKASLSALARAREKGIIVVTYNTTVDGNVASAYVESDQRDLGRSTGREARSYIEQHLQGRATIGILAFLSQAPEQSTARTEGFKEEVLLLPGVTIVAEQDAWLAEQAVKKAGDILTAHPDISLLWAANEGGTIGAVMAVKNAGRAGKIAVFGTDTGEQIADFLLSDDNILQAVTGQRPFEIGSLAVESALRILEGENVPVVTSLSGRLLSRSSPAEVRAFKMELQKLSR